MKQLITVALLAVCSAFSLAAQHTLRQVIVLNEGKFGGPVTVGSYDPVARTYTTFDTLNLRFASDVITDESGIYVAADGKLIRYDLDSKQKVAEVDVPGVRELAVWHNQLLVTRGDVAPLPTYFQVYDKTTLTMLYELSTVSERCAEVKVMNDMAYVAVNGFGTVGKLAVIDLKNRMEKEEIDLGADGLNPESVEIEPVNNMVYTVNALDFNDASVSAFSATGATAASTRLHRPSSCAGSMYYLNNMYFQTSGQDHIGVFSTSQKTVWDSLMVGKSLYGIGVDPVNAQIYLSETDYTTYGKVSVYDFFGKFVTSFDVGVSPGTFAFDVRAASGADDAPDGAGNLLIYPNPASREVNIGLIAPGVSSAEFTLTNALGVSVMNGEVPANSPHNIVVEEHPAGVYFLSVKTAAGVSVRKIVKY